MRCLTEWGIAIWRRAASAPRPWMGFRKFLQLTCERLKVLCYWICHARRWEYAVMCSDQFIIQSTWVEFLDFSGDFQVLSVLSTIPTVPVHRTDIRCWQKFSWWIWNSVTYAHLMLFSRIFETCQFYSCYNLLYFGLTQSTSQGLLYIRFRNYLFAIEFFGILILILLIKVSVSTSYSYDHIALILNIMIIITGQANYTNHAECKKD